MRQKLTENEVEKDSLFFFAYWKMHIFNGSDMQKCKIFSVSREI